MLWLLLFTVAAAGAYYMWDTLKRYKIRKISRTHCKNIDSNVLLLVHSFRDASATTVTVLQSLRSAYCPFRVKIAVYQEVDGSGYDSDIFSMAQNYASNKFERSLLNTNLRIITSDNAAETTRGSLWGWKQLVSRAARNEEWVGVVRPGTEFCKYWDKLLVSQHLKLPKAGVLTVVAKKQKKATIQSDISRNSVQTWMKSLTKSAQLATRHDSSISTFPVVETFNGWIPVLGKRAFHQTPGAPVQVTVASSGLLFCRRRTLERALDEPLADLPIASYANDYVISACLHATGATFFVPDITNIVVLKRIDGPLLCRPRDWVSKNVGKLLVDRYKAYNDFVGVDVSKAIVSGRAKMGLLPSLSHDDIGEKYGTLSEYDRIKRSVAM